MNCVNSFASAVVTDMNLASAIESALASIRDQLAGDADLMFVFYSGYEFSEQDRVLPSLYDQANAKTVIGTPAHAIIEGAKEYEDTRGVSILACQLPDTEILPFSLQFEPGPDGSSFTGWPDSLYPDWPADSSLITFGDAFSFPMDVLLDRLNEDRPGVSIAGGMAAGHFSYGQCRLVVNREILNTGAAMVMLSGGVQIEPIISQGCRPIGVPFVITDVERNSIKLLGGKPALDQLNSIFATLPTRDQREMRNGLQIGRVLNEYKDKFEHGDFLIRNVVQIEGATGTIVVGDFMRSGQTIQFHIRDHQSAAIDLEQLLSQRQIESPAGALLITCNGRGTNLFPDEHHDASLVAKMTGDVPTAGLFAAGEIGPVAGQNFVHGFTACVILFS